MKKLLSLALVAFLATASVNAAPYQHDKNCKKECCKKCDDKCKDACKPGEKCANCTNEECAKKCETKKECCTKQKAA